MSNEFKCDRCGRFIPHDDLEAGRATRDLETPDSPFTAETFCTLCESCTLLLDRVEQERRYCREELKTLWSSHTIGTRLALKESFLVEHLARLDRIAVEDFQRQEMNRPPMILVQTSELLPEFRDKLTGKSKGDEYEA